MSAIIAGNQLIDRGLLLVTTNVPPTNDGNGVPRLHTALLNRDLQDYWIAPAGAGRYLSIQSYYRHRIKLIGLIGYSAGQVAGSSYTYKVHVRTGPGLAGGSLLATHTFVYDFTGLQYGDTGDVYFVLPASTPQGPNLYYTLELPNAYQQWSRLIAGDYVDISDCLGTRWSFVMSDPQLTDSTAPGSSYARDNTLFDGTRLRRMSGSLKPLSSVQAFGDNSAGSRGTSIDDILASQGSTGEIVLLNRISTAGSVSAGDVESVMSNAMYGHFTRPGSLRFLGRGADDGLQWEMPSFELNSLSRVFCI